MSLNKSDLENDIFQIEGENDPGKLLDSFLSFIANHHLDIFIPINYPQFNSILEQISNHVKVLKRASTLTYENIMDNLQYCSAIIATTPRQLSDLKKAGVDEKFIFQVPNPTIIYEVNKNNSNTYDLGYFGRISHPRKGILFLPSVYSNLKKKITNLSIAYYGSGQDLNALKLLHSFDILLKRKILFYGHYHPNEMSNMLGQFKIFLMPSISEGFGIALIEAMSVGTVPIATKIEGVTDYIIQDGYNGFVVDRKKDAFVEKVAFLLENPDVLEKMKLNAMETVRTKFEIDVVAQQYSELLNKVCTQKEKIKFELGHDQKYFKPEFEKVLISQKRKWIPSFFKDLYKIYSITKSDFYKKTRS
ncbi:glycosyltransferase family 4 protein [Cecembia calidifontis]|uniref:Glycosyltransferase involved in cell wall biosynthesis n=1 Tax=Cecembia calidifontis TaxID=1187080 RepID=A0A4Q7PDS7_9BACT|nr:glycosyltransferase family 4 protein [Cecembia calidifontis]RZS98257.1 glycosyltransferase involved in cell wall biosynthesis [Cecembia calidifontis]